MEEQANVPQQGNAAPEEGAGFFEMLATLPQVLQEYLLSDDITSRRDQAHTAHALTEREREEALYADLDVFFGQVPVADFPRHLAKVLPAWSANADRLKVLANDIMGRVLLPAAAFVGDVASAIRANGGDPASYPQVSLAARVVPYAQGAREITQQLGIRGLTEDLQRRLSNLIESYLRAVRTDRDLRAMLVRSRKTGGLEMTDEQAGRVVADVMRFAKTAKYEDAPAPAAAPSAATTPAAAPAPAEPVRRFTPPEIARLYAGTTEEQQEIAARIRRLREVTGNDSAKMRDAYFEVLYPPEVRPVDQKYVIAGLLAIAQDGEVEELLTDDDRYRNMVRAFYEESVGGRAREMERQAFKADPKSPAAVNVLLQVLLRGYGGMNSTDSARFGVRVANALRGAADIDRYRWIAAFDMAAGEFRWADPILLT